MILQQGQLDEQEAPDNGGDDPLNRNQLPPALEARMREIDPSGDVGAIPPALAGRMGAIGTDVNQLAGTEIAEAPSAFESERAAGAPLDVPDRPAPSAEVFGPPQMPEMAQDFRVPPASDSHIFDINLAKEAKGTAVSAAAGGAISGGAAGALTYGAVASAGGGIGLAAAEGLAAAGALGVQGAGFLGGTYLWGLAHDMAWKKKGERMPKRGIGGRLWRGAFGPLTTGVGIWSHLHNWAWKKEGEPTPDQTVGQRVVRGLGGFATVPAGIVWRKILRQ